MNESENNIRVMSFNIRTSTARDYRHAWDLRKHLVVERIQHFDPDLLGLQECQDGEQADFVKQQLPGYFFLGIHRSQKGRSGKEMAPLLFRESAFELLDRGHFWLSSKPDEPGSKLFGSVFPRVVIWAKLRPLTGGEPLYFFNTHFDYNPLILASSAGLLRDRIQTVTAGGRTILSGDFNTNAGGKAYRLLTAPYDIPSTAEPPGLFTLADTSAGTRDENSAASGTIHKFGMINRPLIIDWILASNHFTALDSGVDTYRHKGLFPSDHFPVTAVLAPMVRHQSGDIN